METHVQHSRAGSYRLLAACFYPPESFWPDREQVVGDLTAALRPCSAEAADAAGAMLHSLTQCSKQELSIEYAKLFVGPYELIAPPYGSVYLDEGKRVMGDSTLAVKRMYREYGLKLDDDFKELPDHIAVELEFMYYLIYKMLETERQGDDAAVQHYLSGERQFLDTCLIPFADAFCARIETGTVNDFYKQLSICLSAFMTMNSKA